LFCFVFAREWISLPKGLCWFIPGVAGGILCDAWHSPVWSAECLPSKFGIGCWWRWQLTCSLSVTWNGEAFYGLWVQGSKLLFSLVLCFCQVWLQHLSKVFDSWSSSCLLLFLSCHLVSSGYHF
jgi:hypothetical protein